jgi:orotate phosphoribosyltransferase
MRPRRRLVAADCYGGAVSLHDGDRPERRVGDVFDALPARRGHWLLESGYHTDVWITLDALFVDPAAIAPYVDALAEQMRGHGPTAICGPLFGGAFLAQALATRLVVKFFVVEPVTAPAEAGASLFRARYRLPAGQRPLVRGERVVVVDDVVSAGSSVRAAIAALTEAGASIAAVGALLVLGEAGLAYFAAQSIAVETLGRRALSLWSPADCPMCGAGVPLSVGGDAG